MMTPDKALKRLMDGNRRYVEGKLEHPNRGEEGRLAVADGQRPYAIILGCSDSRVPLEIIFDEGIGDIFVVRVAGNIAGAIVIDSIEFSALCLGSSIIMVLGHESCGAVTAVLRGETKEIESIAELIEPAVQSISDLELAVKSNVRATCKKLMGSSVIARLCNEGKLSIVGGYYSLRTGEVELVEVDKSFSENFC